MRAQTVFNARGLVAAAPSVAPRSTMLLDLVGFAFGLMFAVFALTAAQAVARASAPGAAQIDPYEFADEN